MALRRDEEFTLHAFDNYLRAHGTADPIWRPHPSGESAAPDAELVLASETFSVEITSVFTQYEQTDGSKVCEETIWHATHALVESVERELEARGELHGCYVLTVDGPYCRFVGSRVKIKNRLVEFIRSTKDVPETPSALTFEELPSGMRVAFNTYNSSNNCVTVTMYSDGEGWEWDIVAELRQLVEAAVDKKGMKLQNVPPPRILLLQDRHLLASADDYAELQRQLDASWAPVEQRAELFHSIYIIQSDGEVFPIWKGHEYVREEPDHGATS